MPARTDLRQNQIIQKAAIVDKTSLHSREAATGIPVHASENPLLNKYLLFCLIDSAAINCRPSSPELSLVIPEADNHPGISEASNCSTVSGLPNIYP
jgi:hypothetical protein